MGGTFLASGTKEVFLCFITKKVIWCMSIHEWYDPRPSSSHSHRPFPHYAGYLLLQCFFSEPLLVSLSPSPSCSQFHPIKPWKGDLSMVLPLSQISCCPLTSLLSRTQFPTWNWYNMLKSAARQWSTTPAKQHQAPTSQPQEALGRERGIRAHIKPIHWVMHSDNQ